MCMTCKSLLRLGPIAIVMILTLGLPTSARAQTCWPDLLACYGRAAAFTDTWSSIWAWGMGCDLDFLDCTRRVVLGR